MIPRYVLCTIEKMPYTSEAILLATNNDFFIGIKRNRRRHPDIYLSGLNFITHADAQTKEYLKRLVLEELKGDL